MIDFTDSYSASYRLSNVDTRTWADTGAVDNVNSVTVERDCTGDCPLLETCSASVDGPLDSGWYRLWADVEQARGSGSVALGTFLCEGVGADIEGTLVRTRVNGWSVLKPCSDVALPRGWYAAGGDNGAELVRRLVSGTTPAPVSVVGAGFVLNAPIVAEGGETCLSMAWAILDAGGWCMQVDGMGMVTIMERPVDAEVALGDGLHTPLLPEMTDDVDMSGVPNVYIAVDDDGSEGTAVNDDPDSSVSTVRRGRRVERVDTSPTPVGGETLDAYAARMLAEASMVTRSITYSREYIEGVNLYDVARIELPEQGIEGDFRIVGQSLDLESGILVRETAQALTPEWRGAA